METKRVADLKKFFACGNQLVANLEKFFDY